MISTQCCIAGGGPAGMMLGFLLARAGVDVVVLEKHSDFFRDFRGDTIHPSTLQVLHELGLLAEFLKLPHQQLRRAEGDFGDGRLVMADFATLPVICKFVAMVPQWDFLNFIARHARQLSRFKLLMEHEVTDLLFDGSRVAGVMARTPAGNVEVRSSLVVGADGRRSTVRAAAHMEVRDFGVPIDVLWTRIPKRISAQDSLFAYARSGKLLVLIDRGEYWQCAYAIRKGEYDARRARGLSTFRQSVLDLASFLGKDVEQIEDWESVKLLTVKIDLLRDWSRPGLLCIGDSAHAMSPAGGVGINLAIQDAVAASNILAPRFLNGGVRPLDLRKVQYRREFATRVIQRLQQAVHRAMFGQGRESSGRAIRVPAWIRHLPFREKLGARLIGLGVRPEHVETKPA